MEVNVERSAISSTVAQTDLVSSPILRQCLYVIKTVSEFRNLAYRVTRTRNGLEVVVVYREGILGIFGPPVDPITLTLDPKGRCLLTVPFKPVQRVCIVSQESGQIEITPLLAVLRLISGKGYLFCPGIPERFLAGKVCGKLVVLHRVPFKRYQSSQCPVYYQTPELQQNSNKSSICALCPRCMEAAKWISALPTLASNAAGTAAQPPAQPPIIGQLKSDHISADRGVPARNFVVPQTNGSTPGNSVIPVSISRFLSLANLHNSTASLAPSEPQLFSKNIGSDQQTSGLDVNGNSQTSVILKGNNIHMDQSGSEMDKRKTSGRTKVQVLKALLRNLLQEGFQKKSWDLFNHPTVNAGVKAMSEETNKSSNFHLEKGKHRRRNVCRHCKKEYSTPANLLNHLQRHEALPGTWQKRFRGQKLQRKPNFFTAIDRIFNGSKVQTAFNKKKSASLSETSIRLFLKCLEDVMPSQNGGRYLKQCGYDVVAGEMVGCETHEKQGSSERSQLVPNEQMETETFQTRPGLKRTSSGLSPMQTLLEAAAVVDVDQADENSCPVIPPSTSFIPGIYLEAAVVSNNSQLLDVPPEQLDANASQINPRKSTRLASKRAKIDKKRTREDESNRQVVEAENANAAHEEFMLTNLDLLSTVSLDTAMRQAPISSQMSLASVSSIPLTVLSPESQINSPTFPYTASAVVSLSARNNSIATQPTSKPVSISQQALNNTSGGNVVISRSQDACRPLISTHLQTASSLPPLPPLLFAGDAQGKSLLYPMLSQTTNGQPQTISVSMPSSILRSLVTVGNSSSQPSPSTVTAASSPEDAAAKNLSPNSDCGAIDLSKPKFPQAKNNIPAILEKAIDFSSLSGLPHNIAQLVAGNDNPSEVLHCFMMMAKSEGIIVPESQDIKPMNTIISDKQADSDLQARMFASARNYRIDKALKKSHQVHSVIASSSRVTKPGKGMKAGGTSAAQADEIQCGYKWSGSGGSVKERTQMVRELVPPDVMASFLTKTRLSNTRPQQLSVTLVSTSQPQQPSPQLVQSSGAGWPTQSKPQDMSAFELALNLITSRAGETPALKKGVASRVQTSAPSVVISAPSFVQDWSPASPGSTQRSLLRTSLTNTSGIINQLKGRLSDPPSRPPTDSAKKLQHKALTLSQSNSSPSPSSLSTTPTPPSTYTMSSPSLAAMLRQPPASMYEANHNNMNNSIASTASLVTAAQRNSIINSCTVLSMSRLVHVKTEPTDLYSTEQGGSSIISLPIKVEKPDADIEMVEDETSRDDNSPTNLVMDISPDATVSINVGEKLKSMTTPVS